jgi:probable F420-dependent oxidoreductase
VKIRFGVGFGSGTDAEQLPGVVDRLESSGVDSLWFPELVSSRSIDPVVGMAFALSRTSRLKVGTSVAILPGRHPVLVAKQLASLAAVAPRRVLPVFGLQSAQPAERALFPTPPGKRGAVFDESLRLLRAALERETVTFSGEFFRVDGVGVGTRLERPLDIWLGGSGPAALRRIGRLGDGWLGSFLTPAEAARGREAIQQAAAEAGRVIEPDHFGITVLVAAGEVAAETAAFINRGRPGVDPEELIARDWSALHRLLDGYLDAGLTKFVISPVGFDHTDAFLDRFVTELLPRQN